MLVEAEPAVKNSIRYLRTTRLEVRRTQVRVRTERSPDERAAPSPSRTGSTSYGTPGRSWRRCDGSDCTGAQARPVTPHRKRARSGRAGRRTAIHLVREPHGGAVQSQPERSRTRTQRDCGHARTRDLQYRFRNVRRAQSPRELRPQAMARPVPSNLLAHRPFRSSSSEDFTSNTPRSGTCPSRGRPRCTCLAA